MTGDKSPMGGVSIVKVLNLKDIIRLACALYFISPTSCNPADSGQADMLMGVEEMSVYMDARPNRDVNAFDASSDLLIEYDMENPHTAQLAALDTVYDTYLTNCELYERCYPDGFASIYQSTELCAQAHSRISVLRAEVERITISALQADACLKAWQDASCLDVSFSGELYTKPECVFRGPQKVGELCYYNASCESGFCDQGWSFPLSLLCKERVCVPAIQPGELCTDRNYCPLGLYCQNQVEDARCMARIEPFGTDCRTINILPPCPDTFYCNQETGQCLPSPLEGDACDNRNARCMSDSQLDCSNDTKICTKVPDEEWFIPDGGGCMFQQTKCLHGSYCKKNTFCKRSLKPNDPCDEENECGPSLYCTPEGRCDYLNYEAECRAQGLRFDE